MKPFLRLMSAAAVLALVAAAPARASVANDSLHQAPQPARFRVAPVFRPPAESENVRNVRNVRCFRADSEHFAGPKKKAPVFPPGPRSFQLSRLSDGCGRDHDRRHRLHAWDGRRCRPTAGLHRVQRARR